MKQLFLSFAIMLVSIAASANCPQFYPYGQTIQPLNGVELCNSFFVTQYDPYNQKALFSSELVKPTKHDLKRKDSFKRDTRVKSPIPQMYHNSGMDKGHLVPADNALTIPEMEDTFLMTNMTPQDPKLNRGSWRALEQFIQKSIEGNGKPAIVVTGAIYEGNAQIPSGIPIPSSYYKIVYIDGQKAKAFFAENTSYSKPRNINLSNINILTGMKFPN